MFENARKLRQLQKEVKEYKTSKTTDKILKIKIADDSDVLSKYSLKNNLTLNNELCEFIEKKVDYTSLNDDLKIQLYVDDLNDESKEKYNQAFKNTYTDKIAEKSKELNRYKNLSIIFLLTGIFVLILSIFLKYFINEKVVILFESLDIVAWVFIWEATDTYFIARKVALYQQIRYYKILKADFDFKQI